MVILKICNFCFRKLGNSSNKLLLTELSLYWILKVIQKKLLLSIIFHKFCFFKKIEKKIKKKFILSLKNVQKRSKWRKNLPKISQFVAQNRQKETKIEKKLSKNFTFCSQNHQKSCFKKCQNSKKFPICRSKLPKKWAKMVKNDSLQR